MSKQKNSPHAALWVAATLTLFTMSVDSSHAQSGNPPPPANTDVPVREVVLFSSGVGYFQHEGSVHGDATAELRFKTTQINDILKSLVLNDLGGGRVGVVTYPSQDPLAKTLASFQVDISDNPTQGALLNKLRGARITLSIGSPNGLESVSGTVLGVEEREVPGGKDDESPLKKEFLNLVTDQGIRSLELSKVERFQLDDPGLQEELSRALAAVAGARDQDKKPVSIRFNGQGDRRVRLGYVVETPIWKASYRLVLPDKDAKDKQGSLQGWAIVENQTDNDWQNVRLSLVSGRPISFVQDLYQPLYVPRPTVVPELYASLRPQEYEGGQQQAQAASGPTAEEVGGSPVTTLDQAAVAAGNVVTRDKAIRREMLPRAKAAAALALPGMPAPPPAPMNVSESVAPLSDAAKVGELFQYTVGNVSLARQKSAMIPIINDPVEAEKVSIYNQNVLATHPLNGARIKNNTEDKKHLLQGPVTVFDDGRYAGDARIDDVPPGQTRLLSYGVDLQLGVIARDVEGEQAARAREAIYSGKIVKGVLQVTRKLVAAKEYSAENKSEEDKALVIEYPVRPGWKLTNTPAPVETTDKLYRFQQTVAAGKTEKFTVHEENVFQQAVSLLDTDADDAAVFSKAGEIPAPVRDALAKVIARKQAAEATQEQINQKDEQMNSLSEDQKRIRENIKSVDRTSAYSTRLLKKLDDQESQLEKLRADADALRARFDAQNKELADSLANLNVG